MSAATPAQKGSDKRVFTVSGCRAMHTMPLERRASSIDRFLIAILCAVLDSRYAYQPPRRLSAAHASRQAGKHDALVPQKKGLQMLGQQQRAYGMYAKQALEVLGLHLSEPFLGTQGRRLRAAARYDRKHRA